MKVFITGATGYIGFAVAKAYSQHGHDVAGLVRSEAGKQLLYKNEITPIMGDTLNLESYRDAMNQADLLIHCAGIPGDDLLIDAFLKSKKHFIYTSGIWVAGNSTNKIDETSHTIPVDLVKWRVIQEQRILASEYTTIIRPGCVYGGEGGLTGLFFESGEKGAVEVFGDGLNHWALIHKDDLARLYLDAGIGQVINAVDDSHYTVNEIANSIATLMKVPVKHLSNDETVKRLGKVSEGILIDQWISNDLAKSFNWKPTHDFVKSIELYYNAWLYSKRKTV